MQGAEEPVGRCVQMFEADGWQTDDIHSR
jgi:hypothetical protein